MRAGILLETPLTSRGELRTNVGSPTSSRHRILTPWAWLSFAVIAAAVDLWGSRYNLNPDGISYIEMARHALAGGPHELINGLWSPGYPSLLMWPLEIVASRSDLHDSGTPLHQSAALPDGARSLSAADARRCVAGSPGPGTPCSS